MLQHTEWYTVRHTDEKFFTLGPIIRSLTRVDLQATHSDPPTLSNRAPSIFRRQNPTLRQVQVFPLHRPFRIHHGTSRRKHRLQLRAAFSNRRGKFLVPQLRPPFPQASGASVRLLAFLVHQLQLHFRMDLEALANLPACQFLVNQLRLYLQVDWGASVSLLVLVLLLHLALLQI